MIGSSRSYAIGQAHFQIAGGWKTLGLICASYIVVVISIASWAYYVARGTTRVPFTGAAVMLLLVVETMLLLLLGMLRIAGAVRMDLTTKMIESHRLMPIADWRAALGYVIGATAHAVALAVLNVLLVYIFAGYTRTDLAQVTMSQAVIVMFVLFVWSAALLGAFHGKIYGAMIAVISPIGGTFLYKLLPGLALLISPLMGDTIFHFGPPMHTMQLAYAAAFGAQAAFMVIFFSGACRAYRGTYATTFNLAESLALTCLWSAISIVGIALWEGFHMRLNYSFEDPAAHSQQTIASLIAAMLIALVPIRTLTLVERRRKFGALLSGAFLLAIVAVITAIPVTLIYLPLNGLTNVATKAHFGITALVVAAHVATAYLVFRIMRRAKGGPTFLAVAIFGFVLWIVPLLIELILMWINQNAYHEFAPNSGVASVFSPVVLLAFVWTPDSAFSLMPALAWIVLVPVVLAVLVLTRRGKKGAAVVPVEGASPVMAVVAITGDRPESSPS